MKNNQRGSVLLWAVVIIMVLLILLGAGFSISFSYFNRSLQNYIKQQVYWSSMSGVEAINEVLKDKENGWESLIPESKASPVIVEDISFLDNTSEKNTDIGKVTATLELSDDEGKNLKLTVLAEKGGYSYQISADFSLTKDGWQMEQIYNDSEYLVQPSEGL